MKARHFLLGATLLSAGLLFNAPLFAAVESDVVGYSTFDLTEDYQMVGISFVGLDASFGKEVPVNGFITGDFPDGAQIQVENGRGGYSLFRWNAATKQWGTSNPFSGAFTPTDATIPVGAGVWVVSDAGTKGEPLPVTVAGRVDSSVDIEFVGYKLASFPSFAELPVNSKELTWEGLQTGDQMQVPNGKGGYTVVRWNNGWKTVNPFTQQEQDATVSIKANQAVWLVTQNAEGASCSFRSTPNE